MKKRVLKLKKVTLKDLDEKDLQGVAGGLTWYDTCDVGGYQCDSWPSACGASYCDSAQCTNCGCAGTGTNPGQQGCCA
jgi:hypothetical protein